MSKLKLKLLSAAVFVGCALSLADVALVAYTRVAHQGGFELDDYPAIGPWVERVEAALRITC